MATGIMETMEVMRKSAEKINHRELRTVPEMAIGKAIRQGDIYVRKVEKVPDHFTVETHKLQLVAGSTKGSQHFVAKTPSLKIWIDPNNKDALAGPCIVSRERVDIKHPEHACFNLPAGTYQITYQRDFAYEERKRTQD